MTARRLCVRTYGLLAETWNEDEYGPLDDALKEPADTTHVQAKFEEAAAQYAAAHAGTGT